MPDLTAEQIAELRKIVTVYGFDARFARIRAFPTLLDMAEECLRLREACKKQDYEIQNTLGVALFGLSEEGLPLWGDHVAETLATMAVKELDRLRDDNVAFRAWASDDDDEKRRLRAENAALHKENERLEMKLFAIPSEADTEDHIQRRLAALKADAARWKEVERRAFLVIGHVRRWWQVEFADAESFAAAVDDSRERGSDA